MDRETLTRQLCACLVCQSKRLRAKLYKLVEVVNTERIFDKLVEVVNAERIFDRTGESMDDLLVESVMRTLTIKEIEDLIEELS